MMNCGIGQISFSIGQMLINLAQEWNTSCGRRSKFFKCLRLQMTSLEPSSKLSKFYHPKLCQQDPRQSVTGMVVGLAGGFSVIVFVFVIVIVFVFVLQVASVIVFVFFFVIVIVLAFKTLIIKNTSRRWKLFQKHCN